MFIDCSNMLNEMCGALPVSAEDAPGLQAAADALFERHEANEQLSRDLIDAARAEAVGG